jgi:hypothetical protein
MQVGELYVDVGLRGLSQSLSGLRDMGAGLDEAARKAKSSTQGITSGMSSMLSGALRSVASTAATTGGAVVGAVGTAVTAIAGVAVVAAGATAALAAMGAAGIYALAELGRDQKAGENLKKLTASYDAMMTKIREVVLMAAELIATQTGIGDGLDWATQKIGEMWDEWRPTIVAMIDTAVSFAKMAWGWFSWLYENIVSGINKTLGLLGMSLTGGSETWAKTIKRWSEEIQFFFETFTLRLNIVWERMKLWLSNIWERIKAFVQNSVNIVHWLWDSWKDVFATLGDYIVTVFSNTGENLKRIWTSVMDWISGNDFEINLIPLTEGFKSSIKGIPEGVRAAVQETTAALTELEGELAAKRNEFAARIAARDARAAGQNLLGGAGGAVNNAAREQLGTVGFAALAERGQEETLRKLQERSVKANEEAALGIKRLADQAAGPGLKVQGGGGVFQ